MRSRRSSRSSTRAGRRNRTRTPVSEGTENRFFLLCYLCYLCYLLLVPFLSRAQKSGPRTSQIRFDSTGRSGASEPTRQTSFEAPRASRLVVGAAAMALAPTGLVLAGDVPNRMSRSSIATRAARKRLDVNHLPRGSEAARDRTAGDVRYLFAANWLGRTQRKTLRNAAIQHVGALNVHGARRFVPV